MVPHVGSGHHSSSGMGGHHGHHGSHHHGVATSHHHGGGSSGEGVKAEYILPSSTTDVMSGNDLAVHLPTLMHMGYGQAAAGHSAAAVASHHHHHHLRQQQMADQANMYLQHRSAW